MKINRLELFPFFHPDRIYDESVDRPERSVPTLNNKGEYFTGGTVSRRNRFHGAARYTLAIVNSLKSERGKKTRIMLSAPRIEMI